MAGKRILYALLGLLFTGLAILGVWLPGLPTTPFVLLALWLFSQSSERLSIWLRGIPLLRSALQAADNYREQRTLPRSVKIISQSFAWGSTLLVLLLFQTWWLTALVGAAAIACSIFMTLTPTRVPVQAESRHAEPRAGGVRATMEG